MTTLMSVFTGVVVASALHSAQGRLRGALSVARRPLQRHGRCVTVLSPSTCRTPPHLLGHYHTRQLLRPQQMHAQLSPSRSRACSPRSRCQAASRSPTLALGDTCASNASKLESFVRSPDAYESVTKVATEWPSELRAAYCNHALQYIYNGRRQDLVTAQRRLSYARQWKIVGRVFFPAIRKHYQYQQAEARQALPLLSLLMSTPSWQSSGDSHVAFRFVVVRLFPSLSCDSSG